MSLSPVRFSTPSPLPEIPAHEDLFSLLSCPTPRIPSAFLQTPSSRSFDPYEFHITALKGNDSKTSAVAQALLMRPLDRQDSDQSTTITICTMDTDLLSPPLNPLSSPQDPSETPSTCTSSRTMHTDPPLLQQEMPSPLLTWLTPSQKELEVEASLTAFLHRFCQFAEPLVTSGNRQVITLHTPSWLESLFTKCHKLFGITLEQLCEHIQSNHENRVTNSSFYEERMFHQLLVAHRMGNIRLPFLQKLENYEALSAPDALAKEIASLQQQTEAIDQELRSLSAELSGFEKAKEAVYTYEKEWTKTTASLLSLLDVFNQTEHLVIVHKEQGKPSTYITNDAWKLLLPASQALFRRNNRELFEYLEMCQIPLSNLARPFVFLTPCLQRIERAGDKKPFEEKIQDQLQEMRSIQQEVRALYQRFNLLEHNPALLAFQERLKKNGEEIQRLLEDLRNNPRPIYQEQGGKKVADFLLQQYTLLCANLDHEKPETYQAAIGCSYCLLSLLQSYQRNSANTAHDLYLLLLQTKDPQ